MIPLLTLIAEALIGWTIVACIAGPLIAHHLKLVDQPGMDAPTKEQP